MTTTTPTEQPAIPNQLQTTTTTPPNLSTLARINFIKPVSEEKRKVEIDDHIITGIKDRIILQLKTTKLGLNNSLLLPANRTALDYNGYSHVSIPIETQHHQHQHPSPKNLQRFL